MTEETSKVAETLDEQLLIHVWDKEIALPAFTAPAVRAALTGPTSVGKLPDCMDLAGKLVLARRLIKEGLLQPAD